MAVVIIGARTQARVLLELMEQAGICPIAGLVDDDASLHGTKIDGTPVLGSTERLASFARVHRIHRAVIAIRNNAARRKMAAFARSIGLRLPVLIHPAAIVSPSAKLGEGTVVMAGALVGTETHVGELCIINTRAVVDHHCRIGDGVHIGPGASLAGHVVLGNGVLIGAGATIIPDIRIDEGAIVGAGATVIRNVAAHQTVVGCPAKALPAKTEHPGAHALKTPA